MKDSGRLNFFGNSLITEVLRIIFLEKTILINLTADIEYRMFRNMTGNIFEIFCLYGNYVLTPYAPSTYIQNSCCYK